MLKGVDVSTWQDGLAIKDLGVDFAIVKATEGLGFVDPICDSHIQECKDNGILWGFYHFARENNPEEEAQFFYENTTGYVGQGVPVLDYEVSNYNNREWCERFIERYHELSGIWPMLYISASRCPEYNGSWITEKCGLWLAGYPYDATQWVADECPYNPWPWEFIAIWQFTSSLMLNGWKLDGDYAYMDREAWAKYAGIQDTTQPGKTDDLPNEKSCKELAREVVRGKWGNGWNRKNALDAAYGEGTYDHVQDLVNRGDY